jgi:hypothetical protein
LGPARIETPFCHRQPRTDRAPDARFSHDDRHHHLRQRPPHAAPRQFAQSNAAHDSGEPAVEADYLCRVQAWPIHEPDWKREILRTEWFAESDEGFE